MQQMLQPLPNKISLALSVTGVKNTPLTSHAGKCWNHEKDKVILLQKAFVTKFCCNRLRSPEGLLRPISPSPSEQYSSVLKESKKKTVSTTSHFQTDEPEMCPDICYKSYFVQT